MSHLIRIALSALLMAAAMLPFRTHAAGPATSLTVVPSTVSMSSGQSVTFVVTATDAANVSTDVSKDSAMSVTDPLGSVSGVTYKAGKAGTWDVKVAYQSLTATAKVTVTSGALDEIVINPNSAPETVALDRTRQFSVKGYDASDNVVDNVDVTWSVIGDIGTISATGLFTPKETGTGKVKAAAGALSSEVDVRVTAAPDAEDRTTQSTVNRAGGQGGSSGGTGSNGNGSNTNGATNETINTSTENTNTDGGTTTTDTATTCPAGKSWLWGILLLAFLGGVAVLFAFFPVTRIWPVAAALLGAIILVFLQRRFGCDVHSWWPWLATLGTVGLTVIAFRQQPPAPKA